MGAFWKFAIWLTLGLHRPLQLGPNHSSGCKNNQKTLRKEFNISNWATTQCGITRKELEFHVFYIGTILLTVFNLLFTYEAPMPRVFDTRFIKVNIN